MKPQSCSFWLSKIWCSTVYVVPEETAFATYKQGLKSGTVVQVMVAVKLQSTGSSENLTHDPWFTRPVLSPLKYEATKLQLLATEIWCSTVYVIPEERAFATYKPRARVEIRHSCSRDGCHKTAVQTTGSSED